MGSMAAGVTAAKLFKMSALLAGNTASPLPRATWVKNGIIVAEGSHETYTFMVRRGSPPLNLRQTYEYSQSEELIRHYKDQGIEVFHTHLYKGFGMAAEMPEMEETKHTAEIVHRYGMRVSTYINWNNLMYETLFAEEPRAKNWIQRDASGLPIGLTYGYQQSFRYRPCFTNQEYLDYFKKIIRYAVQEVKTDWIFFDNYDLNPEPDSCHCSVCVPAFRKFLKAKYTPEKRRERFGFENVDYVTPPLWNHQNPPERMEIIQDPAFQEWVDFRCQVLADALRRIVEYTKSLNPEVAIEVNPHGITGGNRPYTCGLDHPRFLIWTESFCTDDRIKAEYTPDGRLSSEIRNFKMAQAFKNILGTSHPDEVSMAEGLAFNQTCGGGAITSANLDAGGTLAATPPRTSASLVKYVEFYRKNRDLYIGSEDVATVGVLRSYASITHHHWTAHMCVLMVEQALIQSRIPFHLIFDEPLPDLTRLKVLVLPDCECFSDEQLSKIRKFVENGGGIVATDQTGLFDEWYRPRPEPGLKGLVEGQHAGRAYQESVENTPPLTGLPQRKRYGQGRVAYIPHVEYDGPLPAPGPNFEIPDSLWKRPKNWEDITEAIRWAANGDIPMEIMGPDFLAANLVEQTEKQRRMIHLVNFNAPNVPVIPNVDVTCQVPQSTVVKEVSMYEVDSESPSKINFSAGPSAVTFTIPQVKTYAIVAITW
jgi:hypothetical protein